MTTTLQPRIAAAALLIFAIHAAVISAETSSTDRKLFSRQVRPFLQRYCIDCHGPDEANGDRRFDAMKPGVESSAQLETLRVMLKQLEAGEMPPEDAEQPPRQARAAAVHWLRRVIESNKDRFRAPERSRVSLRRLNNREYRNTIRDLLKLDTTIYDPTREFPRDQQHEHIDTIAGRLVTSGYLLARYLDAAESSVRRALFPREKPKVRTWTFRDGFRQQPEIDAVHKKVNGWSHLTLYEVRGADKHEGAYAPLLKFRQGVPHDGYYQIRFKAESVNRHHPYDIDFVGTDPSEKFRLGTVPGNAEAGALHKPQPVEPLLAELELEDAPKWYTVRVWLDRGYSPRFVFLNGMMDARTMWTRLVRRYGDQFPPRKRPGIVEARFYAIEFGKLTLRDLGSMPPDRNRFKDYYRYDLKWAMRRETFLFTRYLLDENLDVLQFLDSDFTFVNRPLARLYGLTPPADHRFHKVALTDRRRGGLLGQASILAVTANGIDTSPMIRGVWILENILGTPPASPPANVEPLDPDVRGTKSIREQLAKHRGSESCNACHRKIDPPGFALENFDAIGRWRTHYGKRVKIDASAVLPNGHSFDDVVQFKQLLVKYHRDDFVRGLTRKLLAYATGYPFDESDDAQIDAIVAPLRQRGNGFRDLIELVVLSDTFRSGNAASASR